MKYSIQGYNKYFGLNTKIEANNSTEALKLYLDSNGIKYSSLDKMTTKYKKSLLNKGYTSIEIVSMFCLLVKRCNSKRIETFTIK